MAVFKSSIVSAMSGSMAGITGTRGQTGNVLRRRAIPTNPNTPAQVRARRDLGNLTYTWQQLTADQQTRWNEYAKTLQSTNALGDTIAATGRQAFLKANTLARLDDAAAAIITAPGTAAHGYLPAGEARPNITTGTTVSLIISNYPGAPWLNTSPTRLILFLSQPMSPAESITGARFSFWGRYTGALPIGNVRAFPKNARSTLPDIRIGEIHYARLQGVRLTTIYAGSTIQEQTFEIATRLA